MKAIKTVLWIFLFFFSVNILPAQDYTFKVIASSGVGHKNLAKDENKLKVGTKLSATDKIIVGKESYVGLSYAKGGTVQISVANTYSVKDLETKLMSSKKTVSQKYANFIIGEITKAGEVDINKNPYKYQNVTGSVERGFSDLVVMLPKKTYTYQNEYKVQWHEFIGNKTYTVKVTDISDEVIKTFETKDTTWVLKWDAPEFKEHNFLQIKIIPKEKKATFLTKYAFEKLEDEDLSTLKKSLKDFEHKELNNAQDANAKLNRAIFFEENELYLDALQAYQEAIKLEPKNDAFSVAYNQFLVRKNIGPAELIKNGNKSK